MSSKLNQNTLDLQNILELVNNLPEAGEGSGGSGGGGSTASPIAIATGTYTPTEDLTSVNIEHGLSEIPNFFAWIVEEPVDGAAVPSLNIMGSVLQKTHKVNSTIVHKVYYAFRGYNVSSTPGNNQSSANSTIYMTETTCRMCGNSTYKFLAGYTYRWVAGVLPNVA